MAGLEERSKLPIGFMDSGLGGLSVLREAVRIMPAEDFIYFGDSLNAPYGVKEQSVIRALVFSVVENLLKQGIKGLAVACNTATSAAVRLLRERYPELPIVGIEPAIKPAVRISRGGRILVMATPMTIAQEKYHTLLDQYKDQADIVSVPCEGLMEFVERGNLDREELHKYFDAHLTPYITDDTETIVLGCTHYPFLRPYLNEFLAGHTIELIDGSLGTSMELKRRLRVKNLLREENRTGRVIIQNSSGSQDMIDRSYELLEMP